MASSSYCPPYTKYPYPSQVKVENFVSVKLSRTNYSQWKPQMLRLIKTYGLVSFINGNISSEYGTKKIVNYVYESSDEGINSQDYQDWKRSDALLRDWILGTLDEDILPDVVGLKTAKSMWTTLHRQLSHHFMLDTDIEFDELQVGMNVSHHLPLYKAALAGDWESAHNYLLRKPEAEHANITGTSETALMVAVRSSRGIHFVEKLLDRSIEQDQTHSMDSFGQTALHVAAEAGNIEAAKLLLDSIFSRSMLNSWDLRTMTPIHLAARCGRMEMVLLLMEYIEKHRLADLKRLELEAAATVERSQTELISRALLDDEPGVRLVHDLISFGHYDVALSVLKEYPNLSSVDLCPLQAIALKRCAFQNGTGLKFWQRLIYYFVPIKLENIASNHTGGGIEKPASGVTRGDIENLAGGDTKGGVENPTGGGTGGDIENPDGGDTRGVMENPAGGGTGGGVENPTNGFLCVMLKIFFFPLTICLVRGQTRKKLEEVFWNVPQIKDIRSTKMRHHHALKLVQHLCKEVAEKDLSDAFTALRPALMLAAGVGNHKVVEEIFDSFPSAVYLSNEMKKTVFHVAITNRQENVFNLIHQFNKELRHKFVMTSDIWRNNCLHLAGCLDSEQKLKIRASAAGAALQMQRELQWFKEVEKLTLPYGIEQRNNEGKTPAMIFTETHEDLVKEGERWMKDTASSCTIVAALIATVVFAAAITVPGGNNSNSGLPIFFKKKVFRIFAVSDAIALFSATSSLLMFLSIFTSRYSQEDFLYALPKRLIIGLVTLFLSITSMMVAFGTTIYLVFGVEDPWILFFLVAWASIPATLFVFLQFPLLWDMIKSTYGPSIFHKQSNRILF